MNESKLIMIGDDIYELSMTELEKYKLSGDRLSEARKFIEDGSGDVEGQSRVGEQSTSSATSIHSGGRKGGKGISL